MNAKSITSRVIIILIISITVNGYTSKALGKSDQTWFESESPMLAVMIGFIYEPGSKYSFEQWRENLASDFDADEFAKTLKEAGVGYMIFYDKWIDGYVWHNTKTTKYKSSRDFIKEVASACQKHGLRLIIYFNPVCDNNPEFAYSAIKDRFGKMIPFIPNYWPMAFGDLHDRDFREASLQQLTEILSNYGTIDGVWLDIFSELYKIDYAARNKTVRDDFEKRFGKSFENATFGEISELYAETKESYLNEAKSICEKFQKDAVLTANASMSKVTFDKTNRQLDYWMRESSTLNKTDFHAHNAHFFPRPTEIGSLINKTWFTPLSDGPPPLGRDSENHVVSEAALALCRSSSIYLALTPGHSGKYGQDLQAVEKVGQWYKKLKPYLQGAQLYADVAVVLGTPAEGKDLPSKNEFWSSFKKQQYDAHIEAISICEDLETEGVFAKILYAQEDYSNWPESLSQFKTIILPERVMLDSKHLQKIRDYVRQGGKLISFGHATYLNENGTRLADYALADVFAVQEVRRRGVGGQIKFKKSLRKKYFNDQTFTPLGPVMGITAGPDTETIATIGNVPVVLSHKYGDGKSFYFATGEASFRGDRTFWKGLTEMVAAGPSIKIHNDEIHERKGALTHVNVFQADKSLNRYCAIMNETSQGKVLHIIDRQSGSSSVTFSLAKSSVAQADNATHIESGKNLPIVKKDDRLEITVPCDPVASIVFTK